MARAPEAVIKIYPQHTRYKDDLYREIKTYDRSLGAPCSVSVLKAFIVIERCQSIDVSRHECNKKYYNRKTIISGDWLQIPYSVTRRDTQTTNAMTLSVITRKHTYTPKYASPQRIWRWRLVVVWFITRSRSILGETYTCGRVRRVHAIKHTSCNFFSLPSRRYCSVGVYGA